VYSEYADSAIAYCRQDPAVDDFLANILRTVVTDLRLVLDYVSSMNSRVLEGPRGVLDNVIIVMATQMVVLIHALLRKVPYPFHRPYGSRRKTAFWARGFVHLCSLIFFAKTNATRVLPTSHFEETSRFLGRYTGEGNTIR
jgi:hypothetical protein